MRRTCPTVRLSALGISLIARMSLVVTLYFLAILFSRSPFCTVYSMKARSALGATAVAVGAALCPELGSPERSRRVEGDGSGWLVALGWAGFAVAAGLSVGSGAGAGMAVGASAASGAGAGAVVGG